MVPKKNRLLSVCPGDGLRSLVEMIGVMCFWSGALRAEQIDAFHVGEYSIVLDAANCGGEVVGPEGEFVSVDGFSGLHTFWDDIRTVTHSVEMAIPDGLGFCIDVPMIEDCGKISRYMTRDWLSFLISRSHSLFRTRGEAAVMTPEIRKIRPISIP